MLRFLSIALVFLNFGTAFAEGSPRNTPGFDIMTSRQSGNCIACHAVPGVEGLVSTFGPSLQGVGRKWSTAQLRQWVRDARHIQPNTLMPPYGTAEGLNKANPARPILTEAQIAEVVDTLQSWP
jgi:sulfur-oxidizing protein SoxX